MESSTIASTFAIHMLEGALAQGYNVDGILTSAGIPLEILQQPRSRVTFQQLSRLSEKVVELLDDELYGLLGRPQRRNTYKLLCHCAIPATTIGEALALMSEFHNILDNGLPSVLVSGPGKTAFQLTRRPRVLIRNHYAIEQTLLTIHRTLCWMANARLPILRVDLDFPEPEYAREYRYVFYGAPMYYQQPHCAFHLARSSLRMPNTRTAMDLKTFLGRLPLTLMSQTFEATDLSSQLRKWLEQHVRREHGVPTMEEAAQHFALHPQTLRRRLAREQTTYQEIKTEMRRDLAINLIQQEERSIEEIAGLLGFSESSAFVRAFKGWTDLTPLAFRKMSTMGMINSA